MTENTNMNMLRYVFFNGETKPCEDLVEMGLLTLWLGSLSQNAIKGVVDI
jgi:hypothetical protein